MDPILVLILAFCGGVFPALVWLRLFLKEDTLHPEPKLAIALAFVAGMLSIFVALAVERMVEPYVQGLMLIITWSAIEETVKMGIAALTVLWRPIYDEPIDAVIYMITVALGFAALETSLFLIQPIVEGNHSGTFLLGNLRFLGAALLHVIASAAIGCGFAFAFYKRRLLQKILYPIIGLVFATTLHAMFNFFIMNASGGAVVTVFFVIWIGIIGSFLLFEKVKQLSKPLFVT